MFSWPSKWSREDHNSYDVMFVYRNSGIDRKECNFRWSLCKLKFYLIPDFAAVKKQGVMTVVSAAMGQAFFTLSLGIGAIAIFGSYIDKSRRLTGEAISVAILDTLVALMAGLVIFPACFAFGVNPGSGPNLVFITLPNVFNEMPGSRVWGQCSSYL